MRCKNRNHISLATYASLRFLVRDVLRRNIMPLHQQIPPTHVHRLPVPPTSNNTASGSRLENLFYIIKNLQCKKINTVS